MKIILVDNGSLEPRAVLALRAVARDLSRTVGAEVFPASLAYSDRIAPAELGDTPAWTVEPFLRAALGGGEREFAILPFFVGPSRAVTQALPRLVETLRLELPAGAAAAFTVRIAPALHEPGDTTLAQILAGRVRATIHDHRSPSLPGVSTGGGEDLALADPARAPAGVSAGPGVGCGCDESRLGMREASSRASAEAEFPEIRFRVALVDHGSPSRAVTQVRDEIAAQLATLLSGEVAEVVACSMERRPGAAYDFNDPLLETVLARPKWSAPGGAAGGTTAAAVPATLQQQSADLTLSQRETPPARPAGECITIVAPLFLLPGRHAGPTGDIAQICARARAAFPHLHTVQTAPLARHPLLTVRLAHRLASALGKPNLLVN